MKIINKLKYCFFCYIKMAKRCFCYTLNNYTEEEYNDLINLKCDYQIIAKEVGESGTPHLQGYIEFKSPKQFSVLIKFNSRIHWEPRYGSQMSAVDYCKKDNNFVEIGKMKNQGKRNDLYKICKNIIKLKCDRNELIENYSSCYIKYHNGFDKILKYSENKNKKNYDIVNIEYDENKNEDIDIIRNIGEEYYICLHWDWDRYEYENVIFVYYEYKFDKEIKLLKNKLINKVACKYSYKIIRSEKIYILNKK